MPEVYKRLRELNERKWMFEVRLRATDGANQTTLRKIKREIKQLETTIKINKKILKRAGHAIP